MLRIISRGFLSSAGSMITQGLGVPLILEKVIRIIRGGRSSYKKIRRQLEESFSITAMLIGSNGKELVVPILNKVSKGFSGTKNLIVKASPLELTIRRHDKTRVNVTEVKVRNKKNERN